METTLLYALIAALLIASPFVAALYFLATRNGWDYRRAEGLLVTLAILTFFGATLAN